MENDRPPVVGIVGRESRMVRLEVVEHADQETLEPLVVILGAAWSGTTCGQPYQDINY
jgi:hypothetical protein